ncbi:MAG: BrnT family toxin [Betaproteobacteria bacterium]
MFLDTLALSDRDPDHSIDEERYITFGISSLGQLLAVSHTYRPGIIRIISACRTTRSERRLYEEG